MNDKVLNLLNSQIWLENRASFYYLNLSILCDVNGYSGVAQFFRKQSEEEREHMLKLCDFLLECDEKPAIPTNTFLEDKYEEFLIELVKKDFAVSEIQANEYIEILYSTREGRENIKYICEKYGIDKKQITKLKLKI